MNSRARTRPALAVLVAAATPVALGATAALTAAIKPGHLGKAG